MWIIPNEGFNQSMRLLVINFSEALLSFSEEPHSHSSQANAFLPAVIKAVVLQPVAKK